MYMIMFGWVLWHSNHCRLCNTKCSFCKYIEYELVSFCFLVSTIEVYLI